MTAKQCTCNPSFETKTRFVGRSVKTTGLTMVRSTDPELQQSLPSLGEPVIFVSGSPRTPRSQSCYLPEGRQGRPVGLPGRLEPTGGRLQTAGRLQRPHTHQPHHHSLLSESANRRNSSFFHKLTQLNVVLLLKITIGA